MRTLLVVSIGLPALWACDAGTPTTPSPPPVSGDAGTTDASTPPPPEDASVRRDADTPPPSTGACVADVEAAFAALPETGVELDAWAGSSGDEDAFMPWPRYTDTIQNRLGYDNHIQSVRRLASTSRFVLSGGDPHSETGHLFVVALDRASGPGPLGTNLTGGAPPETDRIVARVDVEDERWHAGGLGVLGDVIAVPSEGGGTSAIHFYDFAEEPPRLLATTIERPAEPAAAVDLTRLGDGRILAAVRTGTMVDFYLSRTDTIEDGFEPEPARWDHESFLFGLFGDFSNAQNIDLLRQCDDTLYLTGYFNTAPGIPTLPGVDRAVLFRVDLGEDLRQVLDVEEIESRDFRCDGACNFDAAAGLHVTAAGTLVLYGSLHYRQPRSGGRMVLKIHEH